MAYKIYEGSPPALLQKRGAELLLVCFHELLVAGFAFFGPSRFFALSEQDKGAHSPQALLCPPQALLRADPSLCRARKRQRTAAGQQVGSARSKRCG